MPQQAKGRPIFTFILKKKHLKKSGEPIKAIVENSIYPLARSQMVVVQDFCTVVYWNEKNTGNL